MTERELVLARREGARNALYVHRIGNHLGIEDWVRCEYPLPRVTRRRVVGIRGVAYRASPHDPQQLEWESRQGGWSPVLLTRSEFVALLDLFDNPDEEVPE